MKKFKHNRIIPRYSFIAILMALVALAVVGKSFYTMTVKRSYWEDVAQRLKIDSVAVAPLRGNIYSCDGRLMAGSLPEYKLFMDFNALKTAGNDSLWECKIDSICEGLHKIFPEKSVNTFKTELGKGRNLQSKHWPIWKRRIDYNTYLMVKALPVFNLSKNASGFHTEEFNARTMPFGELAQRTIGIMYGAKDSAKCGLELSYDSILRGTPGITHRRKVRNRFLSITDTPPVHGADIITTIDVDMQDIADRALEDELKLINGTEGVAIVMEVQTGDIKAIVNLEKVREGVYRETKNFAVSDLLEPGSVFKTASMMVALEDGVVDTTYTVETGGGQWMMYGRNMKDHNWRKGGYGRLTFPQILQYSSNIGVSRIIDEHYAKRPEKFVEGIYRLGLADDLGIPLVGSSSARIRMPKKDAKGHWLNWHKTALPWMSIGYETQVPPISTLAFYNAIANNGTMMRPRFVKQIVKNGEVIAEFPPQVMPGREKICSDKTIKKMQTVLEQVVSIGLGKKAGSKMFKVAGKTGTAQISQGAQGYTSGTVKYLLSFAGFFPADAPRYSCIVCIKKFGTPASGGGMSGVVFHHIAEGIMAKNLKMYADEAKDSLSRLSPMVKNGNLTAARNVLTHLKIGHQREWAVQNGSKAVWGNASTNSGNVVLTQKKQLGRKFIPDLIGMGARDAVFLLESQGVKVKVCGRGKVVSQSLPAGHLIKKGETCLLEMDI
ncbi:MAG: transpeptidase family protein [Prevotella sp.]|nr:transpeptidase family protein [Prevotella sp.]